MLLFKSRVTFICTKNRGRVLHIFLPCPVIKLSFDAKIKTAGLSLHLTCHRSSWVCFICSRVISSTFQSLTRCENRKDIMQGVDIPVTVSFQLSLLWHKAPAWTFAGGLHRWAPCIGWNGHKCGLPALKAQGIKNARLLARKSTTNVLKLLTASGYVIKYLIVLLSKNELYFYGY